MTPETIFAGAGAAILIALVAMCGKEKQ